MGRDRSATVVLNPAGGESIHTGRVEPPRALQPWISTLWTTAWDFRGRPPRVSRMLTDACVHVVVERGRSRVVGVLTTPLSRELAGQGRIVAARFHPGAFRPWCARPVAALVDTMTPLAEVLDLDVPALEAAVLGEPDDTDAATVLSRALIERAPAVDPMVEVLGRAVGCIEAEPGPTRVDEVAVACGLGTRALQRSFREYLGVSPKWVIRRARLLDAARRIQRGDAPDATRLASDLGYFDQAHFTRDFKAVVGDPPAAYARRVRGSAT